MSSFAALKQNHDALKASKKNTATVAVTKAVKAPVAPETAADKAYAQFVLTAIPVLREESHRKMAEKDPSKDPKTFSKGIHTVYSGFNAAMRQHFLLTKEQIVETVNRLVDLGYVKTHFARGGAMIYVASEAPEAGASQGTKALALITAAIAKQSIG